MYVKNLFYLCIVIDRRYEPIHWRKKPEASVLQPTRYSKIVNNFIWKCQKFAVPLYCWFDRKIKSYLTSKVYGRVYSNLRDTLKLLITLFGSFIFLLYLCLDAFYPTEYHVLWCILVCTTVHNRIRCIPLYDGLHLYDQRYNFIPDRENSVVNF